MSSIEVNYTNRLLIAHPGMTDGVFQKAVILIAEHTEKGAVGFILNHGLNGNVIEVLPAFPEPNAPLYLGGPVENNTLHFLHLYGESLSGGQHIQGDLWWGGDYDQVLTLGEEGKLNPDYFRFFVGYSGWSEGQLEKEIREEAWIPGAEFQPEYFSIPPENLWRTLLRKMGGDYVTWANSPDNPSLN